MKKHYPQQENSVPYFEVLDDLVFGPKLPLPDLDRSELQIKIGHYFVEAVKNDKAGPGPSSLTSFSYHFTFCDQSSHPGVWRHINVVPHCLKLTTAYRARVLVDKPNVFWQSNERESSHANVA